MTRSEPMRGSANLEELTAYWRMPSKWAARDLFAKLGVRSLAGKYLHEQFDIWVDLATYGRWSLTNQHFTTGKTLGSYRNVTKKI